MKPLSFESDPTLPLSNARLVLGQDGRRFYLVAAGVNLAMFNLEQYRLFKPEYSPEIGPVIWKPVVCE